MTSLNLQWLENQWRHETDAIKLRRGSNLPFISKIQVFIQGTTMKATRCGKELSDLLNPFHKICTPIVLPLL
jgi:hypothetical protein